MPKAIYAGSFDPPTSGHLWMIQTAVELFREVEVAIGVNPDKRYAYPLADRLALLRACTKDLQNVTVTSFENQFLVTYARSVGARYILRGIRNERDYSFEREMRYINSDLAPEITTVFLMPPREFADVSSSFVRGLIGPAGWQEVVSRFVPPPVYEFFLQKHCTRGKD
ncbi:MAG TPA: pantetheine-phosphate adenylyltransferase [Planctomycetota bacterium]|nr:pantetheine-phosphate adenylyltransferase [Planctomycetota bacterium]